MDSDFVKTKSGSSALGGVAHLARRAEEDGRRKGPATMTGRGDFPKTPDNAINLTTALAAGRAQRGATTVPEFSTGSFRSSVSPASHSPAGAQQKVRGLKQKAPRRGIRAGPRVRACGERGALRRWRLRQALPEGQLTELLAQSPRANPRARRKTTRTVRPGDGAREQQTPPKRQKFHPPNKRDCPKSIPAARDAADGLLASLGSDEPTLAHGDAPRYAGDPLIAGNAAVFSQPSAAGVLKAVRRPGLTTG